MDEYNKRTKAENNQNKVLLWIMETTIWKVMNESSEFLAKWWKNRIFLQHVAKLFHINKQTLASNETVNCRHSQFQQEHFSKTVKKIRSK